MAADPYGTYNSDGSFTSASGSTVGPLFDAATSIGAGATYYTPKTADTATGNAIEAMAPITSQNTASDSAFGGFWTAIGKAVGTATQVYAAKNGVSTTTTASGATVAAPTTSLNTMLLLAGIALVAFIALHKD